VPTVIERKTTAAAAVAEEEKKDGHKHIKFSGDDMKNVVENIQDCSTCQVDEEIEAFKRDNIINSSICDGLTLKDTSPVIKSSCIGRGVKIGRNVQIINSVIMTKVIIGDDVKIVNSLICSRSKIGNGHFVKDDKLKFKTNLPDLKADENQDNVSRRNSKVTTE